jgi:DNA-binding PadR family transcriptional regulator
MTENRKKSAPENQQLYSGLIRLHVLHHAAKEPTYGLWLIEELARHGYRLSPGTLYPMLNGLEKKGYLRSFEQRSGRFTRRFYRATASGQRALAQARRRVSELFAELFEDETESRRRRAARGPRRELL